jgi:lipopolysaccharide assembly outer membrane protein LptD (OstA)
MIQITEVSLQNGYYFALSDHYDLTILGDYYTNGNQSRDVIEYLKDWITSLRLS